MEKTVKLSPYPSPFSRFTVSPVFRPHLLLTVKPGIRTILRFGLTV